MFKTFLKELIQRIKKKICYIIIFRMLLVYTVLAMSIVPTCAPNKPVGNERENRKGLLPNKQQEPFVPKLILNYKNDIRKKFPKKKAPREGSGVGLGLG